MWELIRDVLPEDHSQQISSAYYVEKELSTRSPGCIVLDLGCGTGQSINVFRKYDSQVVWKGLDIEDSPEVSQRQRADVEFYDFDGVNIPFDDETFDIVYSNQVFEHVRYPEQLLAEVRRVLKPEGAFIGSVSALEPYHSFSYWNFTPYGWFVILGDAGLDPIEFRPGIDGISLIKRSYLGRPAEASNWFTLSPLNSEIDEWASESQQEVARVNLRKLTYCGHLVFYAKKQAG